MSKNILIFSVLSIAFLVSSCELQTEQDSLPLLKPSSGLVINEVFTLPSTNQRAHSWVEFYNPTQSIISTKGWSMTFRTTGLFSVRLADSLGRPFPIPAVFDSALAEGDYTVPFPEADSIRPGGFLTITNNENLLTSYTDYGPGSGQKFEIGRFTYDLDTVRFADTLNLLLDYQAVFFLRADGQIIVRDNRGSVVDVVRYGNYSYSGSGSDPYPGNKPKGGIPEYQSIARWGGGYFTGNTADDFYVTGSREAPQTRPIPHWLSQDYKQQ